MTSKGFVELPVEKLRPAGWNYKAANPRLTNKLLKNIQRNGQIENLIVRELEDGSFEVVNGNHRLEVLKMLAVKTAVCFNFGAITDTAAARIAIETNETKFASDQEKLTKLLAGLVDEFGMKEIAATTAYSVLELRDRMEFLDYLVRTGKGQPYVSEHFQDDGLDPPSMTLSVEGLTEEQIRAVQQALDATGKVTDAEALLTICRGAKDE